MHFRVTINIFSKQGTQWKYDTNEFRLLTCQIYHNLEIKLDLNNKTSLTNKYKQSWNIIKLQ